MIAARVLALLSVAALACGGTTGLPPFASMSPARIYTLPSGLRVVVEQDEASGMIGVVWVVDAGEADNPPGKPGVAHLVEHLLLTLPDQTGVPTRDRMMALGAHPQAFTSAERMDFFAFAPARALDDLVAVVLARAANPLGGVSDGAIARERHVIAQELELRRADSDAEGSMRVLSTLTVAGRRPRPSFEEMEKVLPTISRPDLDAFVAQRYQPRRTTLVVSGAIPRAWDKQLLARLPPSLAGLHGQHAAPERRPVVGVDDPVPVQAAIESVPAPVGARELWLGWRLPPARGAAAVPLKILDAVADQMLVRALEQDFLPGVVSATASTSPSSFGSTLLFRLVLDAKADPAHVQDRARSVGVLLGRLSGGVLPNDIRGDLQLALRQGVLQNAIDMENAVTRMLVRAQLAHTDPGVSLSGTMDKVGKASLDDFAGPWIAQLSRMPYRSVLLTPGAPIAAGSVRLARALDSLPGAVAENPLQTAARERPEGDSPVGDTTGIAQASGASAALVTQLSNGLTVIALRRPGLPLASMLLGFHAEQQPSDVSGQRMGALLGREDNLKQGPRERTILQHFDVDLDGYRETLGLFSSNTRSALDLLAEEADTIGVRRTADLDRWVAKTAQGEKTPVERARRSYAAALWGNHVYGLEETSEAVRRVTPDQIRRWLDRVRRPVNGALVIVGDIDPPAIARQAASALARWGGDRSKPPPPPTPALAAPVEKRQRPSLVSTPDPGATIADLRIGCLLPAAQEHRDILPGALLGHVLNAELRRRFQDEMGASYAPSVDTFYMRGGSFFLEGEVDVDERVLPRALDVLRAWLTPDGTASIEPGMFERERLRLAQNSSLRAPTNASMARALFDAWNMGWPPAVLDAFPGEIASVTLDDVQAALRSCRASAVISVVAAGQAALAQ
jgi:zinc protease